MKTEEEIKSVLKDLQEAHQWALRNRPSDKVMIATMSSRIGFAEWVLGMYDEDDAL